MSLLADIKPKKKNNFNDIYKGFFKDLNKPTFTLSLKFIKNDNYTWEVNYSLVGNPKNDEEEFYNNIKGKTTYNNIKCISYVKYHSIVLNILSLCLDGKPGKNILINTDDHYIYKIFSKKANYLDLYKNNNWKRRDRKKIESSELLKTIVELMSKYNLDINHVFVEDPENKK